MHFASAINLLFLAKIKICSVFKLVLYLLINICIVFNADFRILNQSIDGQNAFIVYIVMHPGAALMAVSIVLHCVLTAFHIR